MNTSTLLVEALSDSFASVWPQLAAELGVGIGIVDRGARPAPTENGILLIAAGGAEDQLLDACRRAATVGGMFAGIVADADYRLAANVIRAGADQLFVLPRDLDLLRSWLRERVDVLQARRSQRAFTEAQLSKYRFEGIFGSSPALVQALERAARIIPHGTVTVLLAGETGTGKELFARAIHYNGPRAGGPFVDINCAALPDALLESELFGHEKGAFTGATVAKPGLFEVASGGTIFLDEIGHLALPLQAKLLRVLQERTVRHVGGAHAIPVDVRVIAASHVNLQEAVRRREFREDLFYRLNVVPITLPPLRERREDIVPLARHFLRQFADEYGVEAPALMAGAARALRERDWPGNIRELRNVIERAVLLGAGRALEEADLAVEGPASPDIGGLPSSGTLEDAITAFVMRAMDAVAGNKSAAARRLGISRTRLLRILDGQRDDAGADTGEAAFTHGREGDDA